MQAVHSQVVPEGRQGVSRIDRHLVLSSDLGFVDVLQLDGQLFLKDLEVVLWRVVESHDAPQGLVGVGLESLQLYLLSRDGVGEREGDEGRLAPDHREGATLLGLECQPHCCRIELDLVLELLVPLCVVGNNLKIIRKGLCNHPGVAKGVPLLVLLQLDEVN